MSPGSVQRFRDDDMHNNKECPMSKDELFVAAREAMAKAHAPYSKFPVGAAIRAEDGKIYTGANIENLSFPEGWCAETTAISHMVMAGQRKITKWQWLPRSSRSARPAAAAASAWRNFPAPAPASISVTRRGSGRRWRSPIFCRTASRRRSSDDGGGRVPQG